MSGAKRTRRPGLRRQPAADVRLLSLREVDRLYRLRKGSASRAVAAQLLPGRQQGRAFLVSAKRAEELFGAAGRGLAAVQS